MSQSFVARLQRVLPAPPEDVFAAWTDAEDLKIWFLPGKSMAEPEVELDVRVGGQYRIIMRDEDGRHEYGGEYLEIDPGRRLKFTWIGPSTHGEATVVTVDLKAVEGGTELTLVHEKLPDAAQAKSYEGGWGRILAALTERLSA
ncbi:MAG: SRPBCC domain-containing protein [Alphaproteobacteria bacterium]|nr:SRPBCC domain-containing protein [Alphaproteobacteria bacterium]